MSAKSKSHPKDEVFVEANGMAVRGVKWPLIWGSLATVACYSLIPTLPVYRDLAERYLAGHPVEYVTTALFFIGMAILIFKGLAISVEQTALARDILSEKMFSETADMTQRASAIEARRRALPPKLRQTHLFERVRAACAYLRDGGSSEGLEGHLKYLAELASERQHGSYALIRTVTWAIPILGFLGTVLGITIAIASLNFKEYESSMANVVGGLAIAFDTTAQALAMSLVLVFFTFLVERSEQGILDRVEDYGISHLLPLFPTSETTSAGQTFADAEALAARQLLEQTDALITRQTALWNESLEAIRESWTAAVVNQKQSFEEHLRQGQIATLTDHAKQLAKMREEFLQAFVNVSQELRASLEEARESQNQLQESFQQQLGELWLQVRHDVKVARDEEAAQRAEILDAVAETVGQWQQQLAEVNRNSADQLDELRLQREALAEIARGEQHLGQLQVRLTENLEAVRTAEVFEETLHSLNAAVHLLTTRVKPKAA